ncbi:MAG TPA: MFS transporter [Vicinamibacterales bacterium]|jgi:ACS family hexuronate transporter-like MFS transporter
MQKRWRVAILVGAAIAISYLDRQSLPVAVKAIQQEIPISNTQFGDLTSLFLLAYGLMYAGGGALVDRVGTRRGFLAVMIFWSLACASHALALSVGMLAASRFLLGLGEGGGFPAATKAIAEWFPVDERATAMGLVNAGTAVGAVAAPPAIAAILVYGSWRWVFVACGAAGLAWAAWWWRAYEAPVAGAAPARVTPGPDVHEPADRSWSALLRHREVWGLVTAKFLTDAAWFFYIAWLPKYLYDARHFDVKEVGAYAWVPYAASGVGSLLGGWLSSALIRRGRSIDFSRKLALAVSAAVMPAIVFVAHVPVGWALGIFSLAFFGQQSWSTLVMIVPTDLFERQAVASVAGLVGFGGAMGGLLMNLAAGRLLDAGFSYGEVFAVVGTLHVIAFGVLVAAIPRIRRLA